ncbi:hypothetical protein CAL14_17445 [Bordetella genomosp. 9]|uniref:hypothetical protein n=1 Tax=Bordetella genomosp. 9 TaxID=1416803 RepID=UPI000A28FE2B|nr:hypothetical protein [Bordetella genomosp. 9]ARP91848.1 hypothetical protein CAL14_17445 [Bordetella genomosp. 9]
MQVTTAASARDAVSPAADANHPPHIDDGLAIALAAPLPLPVDGHSPAAAQPAEDRGGAHAAGSHWQRKTRTPIRSRRNTPGHVAAPPPAPRWADRLADAFLRLQATGYTPCTALENDETVMNALARASGLYPADAQPHAMSAGQKRFLAGHLAMSLTRDIHWDIELSPSAGSDGGVYIEHGVVRNGTAMSIAAVRAAVAGRIDAVLRATGVPPAQRGWLAPALCDALIADPTLGLRPPPADIRYGSRQWATLWMGLALSRELALPSAQGIGDVIALGQAAMTDPDSNLSTQALLRMAQAAGAIDAAHLAGGDIQHALTQLRQFVMSHFEAEFPLLDELGGLSRSALATDLLTQAGIDADRQIEVKTWILPAAWGPFKLELPLLFASYRTAIRDYYVDRDTLSASDVEALRRDADDPRPDPDKVLAKLPPSLRTEFERRFDSYKRAACNYLVRRIGNWLASPGTAPAGEGDASAPRVAFHTVRLQRYRILNPPPMPGAGAVLLDERSSKWLIVDIESGAQRSRAIFDPGTETAVPIPPGLDIRTWASGNTGLLFEGYARQAPPAQPAGATPRTLIDHEKTAIAVDALAQGPLDDLSAWLSPALASRIERARAAAAGQSASETLKEIERGLVPFRGAYLAIRNGDLAGAVLSGLLDVAAFLPGIGEGIKTGMTAARAAEAALQAGLVGWRNEGLRTGLILASRRAGQFAGTLGRQAAALTATLARDSVPHPYVWLSPADMMGRAGVDDAMRTAAQLADTHPAIAQHAWQAGQRMAGADFEDGRWIVASQSESAASATRAAPPAGAADDIALADTPLYLTAQDGRGAALPLQRHGDDGYVQFNPETLEPVGPLLLPDRAGKLQSSLPVDLLQRHHVREREVLDALTRTPMREDGTLALGDRIYARVGGDYLGLLRDRAASTPGRTVWTVVDVPGPATRHAGVRIVHDRLTGVWRLAERPGLQGGGNPINAIRAYWHRRRARAEDAAMTRQSHEIAHRFLAASYNAASLNVWHYPDAVRARYPGLIARSLDDHFIKGPDGRIRRFPGGFVADGCFIRGYSRLLDPELLRATDMMADFSQLNGAKVLAGYALNDGTGTVSFLEDGKRIASLAHWGGVYPLSDGAYLFAAPTLAGDAHACEQMLLSQAKPRREVLDELRRTSPSGPRDATPQTAINRLLASLARRLRAAPYRLPLKGVRHDEAMKRLKESLSQHGPCILHRNGRMVMLDAIEQDGEGVWLVIRDPLTCTRARVPDCEEFWSNRTAAMVATAARGEWTLPDVDAVFIPQDTRLLHRALSSASSSLTPGSPSPLVSPA